MPTAFSSSRSELRALTGLRFLAAFLVVIHHYLRPAVASAPSLAGNIAENGYAAVGLFFLLSGFVLAWRYIHPAGEFRGSAGSFWLARGARIYPAYLLAFLLSAPFVAAACLHVNPLPTGILKLSLNGLLSLAFLQSWTPQTAWYWNTPAWSLSVEAFFYLCFPLLASWVGRLTRRQLLSACGFFWVLAMLPPAGIILSGRPVAAAPPLPFLQALFELGPLFRLPEFLIGVLLGRYFFLTRVPKRTAGITMSNLGLLGCAAILSLGALVPRVFLSAGLLIPFSALLLLGLAEGRGWLAAVLASPLLVYLGEASYGVYILQWPLAQLFRIPSGTSSLLQFALFSSVLVAAAGLSLRYLETPVRKAVLRRLHPQTATLRPQSAACTLSPVPALGELP